MVLVESALRVLPAKEDISQQCVRRGYVRHRGHGFTGMGSRFLPAAQKPVGFGKFIMARGGIGLQCEAAEQSRFGLGILLGFIENGTQLQVCVRGFVIESSGSLQRLFRFLPIFLLEIGGTQESVGLRKCLVELDRLAKMRNALFQFVSLQRGLAFLEFRAGIFRYCKISSRNGEKSLMRVRESCSGVGL